MLSRTVTNGLLQHIVEIERLINESDELIRAMRIRGRELKHDQLPISALVRCPLIAFRWQISDQKVYDLSLCKVVSSRDA